MTKHAKDAGRSKARSRQGTADKIWAVGLAGATCVGLVGAVGVRAAQDAVASTQPPAVEGVPSEATAGLAQVVNSGGLTEQQLDEYARSLEVERLRLEAYHAELLDVAARLQESADAINQAQTVIPASASPGSAKGKKTAQPGADAPKAAPANPKPVAEPVAKPVPKPAAAPQVTKPQAQTRGS